jgi:hypothetical protein
MADAANHGAAVNNIVDMTMTDRTYEWRCRIRIEISMLRQG